MRRWINRELTSDACNNEQDSLVGVFLPQGAISQFNYSPPCSCSLTQRGRTNDLTVLFLQSVIDQRWLLHSHTVPDSILHPRYPIEYDNAVFVTSHGNQLPWTNVPSLFSLLHLLSPSETTDQGFIAIQRVHRNDLLPPRIYGLRILNRPPDCDSLLHEVSLPLRGDLMGITDQEQHGTHAKGHTSGPTDGVFV